MAQSPVNRKFSQQKAALTRAVNKTKADSNVGHVYDACKKAVEEWSAAPFNGAWPDDWARWQRALDDAYGRLRLPPPTLEYL